jgi:hypothetical protein
VGLTSPHRKKANQLRKCYESLGPERTLCNDLSEGILVWLRKENTRKTKMDLLEIGLSVVDWTGLAQDRYRWRVVNSVMNLRVP